MAECPTCGRGGEGIEARLVEAVSDRQEADREVRRLRRENGRLRTELEKQRKKNPLQQVARELYDFWHDQLGKNANTTYDGKREKMLLAILEHYDREPDLDGPAFLRKAILGLKAKPYVGPRGRCDTGTKAQRYDDLKYAVQDAASVERFAGYADTTAADEPTPDITPFSSWPLSSAVLEQIAYAFHVHHGGSYGLWPLVCAERTEDTRRVFELARANLLGRVEERRRDWRLTSPREGDARVLPLELRQVLDAFAGRGLRTTGRGHQHMGQCPMPDRHAHGDRTPSVSITEMADGATLLNCFGCGAGHRDLRLELGLYHEADRVMTGGVPTRGQLNFAGGRAA